jgi:pimeloyl-ACP methyl ester carboxylesterase
VPLRLTSMALVASLLALLGLPRAEAGSSESGLSGTYQNVGSRAAPLHLWVEEGGDGEPLLLLHGFGANNYTWRHIAPDLARDHHVIAVDLKGSGRSDKPFDDSYGVLDQVKLLQRLIEGRGLSALTLVGHSLGGGVALALALDFNARWPGALRRLILIDSIAYRQRLPLFIQALQVPLLGEVGIYAVLPEIEAYQGLYVAYHHPSRITFAAVRAYAEPLYEPGGRYALLRTAAEIIPGNLATLVARYPTIHQPTLLIWCAEDPVVPFWVGRRLARALPAARLALLRGCGHVPQEELPLQTLARVRRFLR